MCDNIKIVIGSWGSYNECNERALGSKWLDLSDYNEWDEIVEELKQFPNRDERVVQNNEEPKENKVVRRSFL